MPVKERKTRLNAHAAAVCAKHQLVDWHEEAYLHNAKFCIGFVFVYVLIHDQTLQLQVLRSSFAQLLAN